MELGLIGRFFTERFSPASTKHSAAEEASSASRRFMATSLLGRRRVGLGKNCSIALATSAKMFRVTQRKSQHRGGSVQLLAAAPGYRVYDMRCTLGPRDPANQNQYPAYRVAAIVGGTFKIRSTLGDAVPVVGSLLLGNACDCYCCRHDTPNGDRCINFDFAAEFLEQVRTELGVRGVGERFRRVLIPPSRESTSLAAAMEAVATGSTPAALQEAAFEVAAAALTATHTTLALGRRTSFRNERSVMRAARYVASHYHESCTLEELAARADMSPFHFLRVYRRVTGQTPHRHVLATRLRNAAQRLSTTRDRIADIALAVGFGDLSHFNATFRQHFRVSPGTYRAARARDSLR
jgi:AraC family transcriptional regulator